MADVRPRGGPRHSVRRDDVNNRQLESRREHRLSSHTTAWLHELLPFWSEVCSASRGQHRVERRPTLLGCVPTQRSQQPSGPLGAHCGSNNGFGLLPSTTSSLPSLGRPTANFAYGGYQQDGQDQPFSTFQHVVTSFSVISNVTSCFPALSNRRPALEHDMGPFSNHSFDEREFEHFETDDATDSTVCRNKNASQSIVSGNAHNRRQERQRGSAQGDPWANAQYINTSTRRSFLSSLAEPFNAFTMQLLACGSNGAAVVITTDEDDDEDSCCENGDSDDDDDDSDDSGSGFNALISREDRFYITQRKKMMNKAENGEKDGRRRRRIPVRRPQQRCRPIIDTVTAASATITTATTRTSTLTSSASSDSGMIREWDVLPARSQHNTPSTAATPSLSSSQPSTVAVPSPPSCSSPSALAASAGPSKIAHEDADDEGEATCERRRECVPPSMATKTDGLPSPSTPSTPSCLAPPPSTSLSSSFSASSSASSSSSLSSSSAFTSSNLSKPHETGAAIDSKCNDGISVGQTGHKDKTALEDLTATRTSSSGINQDPTDSPPTPVDSQCHRHGNLEAGALSSRHRHSNMWWFKHGVPVMPPPVEIEKVWRQGLPPRIREIVWPIAIGNVLRITDTLYSIFKRRARRTSRALAQQQRRLYGGRSENGGATGSGGVDDDDVQGGDGDEEEEHGGNSSKNHSGINENREGSVTIIEHDLPRTFPTLAFFRFDGPLHDKCREVLEAWTCYRPDVGYVQGMSFLAATLLMYLPDVSAFICFCNLLNSPSLLGLYKLEPERIQTRYRIFCSLLERSNPRLSQHLDIICLPPETYLLEWFLTLYTKPLSLEVASAVWDVFLLDGEVTLYVTAVALLRLVERKLMASDFEKARLIIGEIRKAVTSESQLLEEMQKVLKMVPPSLYYEIAGLANSEFSSHPHSFPT